MTGTATVRRRRGTGDPGGRLSGTLKLVRLMLRRDRVQLPVWTGAIGLLALYLVALLPVAYGDSLDAIVGLFGDPTGRLMTGPGYGFDDPSIGQLIANGYGLYFLLVSAFMSILLVVRHTRAEEQSGRAELIRANVVGSHAQLAAALVVALITNGVASVLVAVVMLAFGYAVGPSMLFAASIGAVGLAFGGVAAITVQVPESARAAAGMAGAVLGAAFVLRAGGDMARVGGNALSWLSPLGWGSQTAPFVLDRWWPLGLAIGFAAVTTAAGFALSARRDVGAGLFAARSGRSVAAPWLGSPLALAWRLQRTGILWWAAALGIAGLVFGAFGDGMTGLGDVSVLDEVFGSTENIVVGYLSFMAVYMSYVVGIFAILSVQGLRGEESGQRAAPVLATPVSRWSWMGSHLAVAALAVVALQALTGFATGLGAAAGTGEWSYLWDVTLAHLAHTPAVLIVLGVAALLYGLLPRAVAWAWAVLAYGMFVGTYGALADLPDIAFQVSPFAHIAQTPLEPFSMTPVGILSAIAIVLVAVGLLGFRNRGIDVN